MPLVRRVPKFGFHNPMRVEYEVVNVERLDKLAADGKLAEGKVDPAMLHAMGVVSKKSLPVKILGNGELKAKLEVHAHAFSKSALQKIEAVGGKAQVITTTAK
jgi:large subunit ribosomal protein L15